MPLREVQKTFGNGGGAIGPSVIATQELRRATCGNQPFSLTRSTVKSHGAGAAVVAFQRNTTDAVVVLSVFLNPGTGSFEYRSR